METTSKWFHDVQRYSSPFSSSSASQAVPYCTAGGSTKNSRPGDDQKMPAAKSGHREITTVNCCGAVRGHCLSGGILCYLYIPIPPKESGFNTSVSGDSPVFFTFQSPPPETPQVGPVVRQQPSQVPMSQLACHDGNFQQTTLVVSSVLHVHYLPVKQLEIERCPRFQSVPKRSIN